MFEFRVLTKNTVIDIIQENFSEIFSVINNAYLLHSQERAFNPPSYFLRFKHKPNSRIIALPCSMKNKKYMAGIKWISSFPDNIDNQIQRASAVFILNDGETGYPLACIESSYISAIRTALSAILAGEYLHKKQLKKRKLGIVGAGFISQTILNSMLKRGWTFDSISIYDQSEAQANTFCQHIEGRDNIIVKKNLSDVLQNNDTIVFATTSLKPYVTDIALFNHAPVVLHISLRDLSADIILQSENYVDDVEHVLAANTSADLAYQSVGHHDFIAGTYADLAQGLQFPSFNKPLIFSPMGMGILDLALAEYIYESAVKIDQGTIVADFFGDVSR